MSGRVIELSGKLTVKAADFGIGDRLHHLEDELVRLGAAFSPTGKLVNTGSQPPYFGWHGPSLIKNGFNILPVRPRSKAPAVRQWQKLAANAAISKRELRRLKHHSIGIDTRKTPVIDIDCTHSSVIDQLRREIGAEYGALLERLGRAPRLCVPFRTDEPFSKIVSSVWLDAEGKEQRMEVLGAGQQFVAYGYHPSTGLPYTWYLNGEPFALTRILWSELPQLTREAALDWVQRFDEVAASHGWQPVRGPSPAWAPHKARDFDLGGVQVSDDELAEVVWQIPDPHDYQHWIEVGMALHHQTNGSEAGLEIWREWSSQAENFESAACDRKWRTFSHDGRETFLTGKSLYRFAGLPAPAGSQASDFPLSEDAVAQAFADRHDENLRFDHEVGKWMHFDGVRWHQEKTDLAFDFARKICRDLRGTCLDQRKAFALSRASAVAAIERFARADRTFAVLSDIWDNDPLLFGTPAGTVDLRTGRLREPRREDYITMASAVAPAVTCSPQVDMPVFWKFLHEVTAGDMEVIAYLQRYGGYCLTGDTREQMLLFVYGPGGNGKSLLQTTFAQILGEYAWTAPPEMFISSRSERHPTELASLRGKRLVIASENESGKAWAEVRIKQMTGGDRITARLMRQDFFEFDLNAKFFFVGNNQPALRQVDDAMRRRFHVLEFLHVPANPDNTLATKLRSEWPAILRWLIDGCLAWQREGLAPPEAIRTATAEYFAEQDVVQEWLDLSCEIGSEYEASNQEIREDFEAFSHSRTAGSSSDPLPALRRRFERIRNANGTRGRGLRGFRLRNQIDQT